MDETYSMKIRAIAPWFGSKRNLAPAIVQELGPHSAYWEPFCGSLAVLLAKNASSSETVNDLHGELINLARVLSTPRTAYKLYDRLMRFVMHEDTFRMAATAWKDRGHLPASDIPDVDRATEFMVCCWFGRNGLAGTQSYNQGFCVRYTKNGGHAATRWRSVVDSIPAWHHRLRGVTILNRNGFDLLGRIEDAKGVVIYVDPPYYVKGADYVYDFAAEDHTALAQALSRFAHSRVVVSYYDHPTIRKLYRGWTFQPLKASKALVNQGKRNKKGAVVAPELLIINGASNCPHESVTGDAPLFEQGEHVPENT